MSCKLNSFKRLLRAMVLLEVPLVPLDPLVADIVYVVVDEVVEAIVRRID